MKFWAACLLGLALMSGISGCASLTSTEPASLTDSDIVAEAQDRLRADPIAGRTVYVVTCEQGVLTLEGVVKGATMRAAALSAAKSTPGVSQVVDRLRY